MSAKSDNLSAIDTAIANAKKRKAARESGSVTEGADAAQSSSGINTASTQAAKRPKLTDDEKAARDEARNAERAQKRAAKAAARDQKKLERDAAKQAPHLRKVMKASERLGTLAQAATLLFNEATANLSAAELATLAAHIQHFNRTKATERALTQKLEVGQRVTITGGDPRYIGREATVAKAQRIRCYVSVEGVSKPIYLFSSDVSPVANDSSLSATG
jgi:hypothetical protein